jgi:hypothetical protein
VLLLVLYVALHGRWALRGRLGELFSLELLAGASLAAIVAVIFFLRGVQTALLSHDDGVAQPFCLAAGSALAFVFFALRAHQSGVHATLRSTRRPPPQALA